MKTTFKLSLWSTVPLLIFGALTPINCDAPIVDKWPLAQFTDVYLYGDGIMVEWANFGIDEVSLTRYAFFNGFENPETREWTKKLRGSAAWAGKYFDNKDLKNGVWYYYVLGDDGYGFRVESPPVKYQPAVNAR